jgi:hypothetical protein
LDAIFTRNDGNSYNKSNIRSESFTQGNSFNKFGEDEEDGGFYKKDLKNENEKNYNSYMNNNNNSNNFNNNYNGKYQGK